MTEAYGAFAYAYDKALGERFFTSVRRMLDDLMKKHPTPKRTHLDVACGSGLVLKEFRKRGWKSVGIDASVEMLQVARKRSPRVVAADFRALPFRSKFARITCLYDSLNHMLDGEDLIDAFRAIRGVMDHDSLFLFDMNHPQIYPEVWGVAEPFISEGADYRLEIATSYRKRDKLGKALVSGWAQIEGERVEIREVHQQRAYSERDIIVALAEAALALVDIIDFDPYDEGENLDAPTVKLFFVVRPTTTVPKRLS